MIGLGMSELVLMTVLFGGAGAPLGIPPGPEDAFLAKIAPESCLYYSSWAGMAKPKADSSNRTERLLAEPEIQQLITKGLSTFRSSMQKLVNDGRAPPAAKLAATVVPELVLATLSNPAAVYVERVNIGPNGPDVKAMAIAKLGKQAGPLKAKLEQLQKFGLPDAPTTKIGGHEFYKFQPDPSAPTFYWGQMGEYLLLAVGDGSIEGMLERAKTDPPQWHAAIGKQMPVERRGSVSYINLKTIINLVSNFAPPPVRATMDKLGAGSLTTITAVTGLDKDGFVNKSVLGVDVNATALRAFAGEPLAATDLSNIPADATVAGVFRLDLSKVLDVAMEVIKSLDEEAVAEIKAALQQGEQVLGFKLREDLLASIGSVWQLYTSPRNGGIVAGWTASVRIKDRKKFERIHAQLLALAKQATEGEPRAPSIRNMKYGEHVIHYVTVPDDVVVAPAWCLTKDRLIVGLFPQVLKGALASPEADKSLADHPTVQPLLTGEKRPTAIFYQDSRELFRLAYPFLQYAVTMASGEIRRAGIDLDPSILPSPASIDKHLRPGTVAVYQTKNGFETQVSQTIPGSNILGTLPILGGFVMPAIAIRSAPQARAAAAPAVRADAVVRRAVRLPGRAAVRSKNNLKMIGLGLHNYHDTYNRLPAAYNTDGEGKKLLSWRVHLLPFVEQQALYREFRLNEAWDSPHNRKLIARMPRIYRSPSSRLNPRLGKTHYLGMSGKGAIFTKPRENGSRAPKGTAFKQVKDGNSNTVAVVQVGEKRAIEWTRPDDIDRNAKAAFQNLFAAGSKVNLLFSDGHVQTVALARAKKAMKAWSTIAGDDGDGDAKKSSR